jgi:hypothetical protein
VLPPMRWSIRALRVMMRVVGAELVVPEVSPPSLCSFTRVPLSRHPHHHYHSHHYRSRTAPAPAHSPP